MKKTNVKKNKYYRKKADGHPFYTLKENKKGFQGISITHSKVIKVKGKEYPTILIINPDPADKRKAYAVNKLHFKSSKGLRNELKHLNPDIKENKKTFKKICRRK